MDWTDDQIKAFADLFLQVREGTGLKQYQVSDRSGVAASTIGALERAPYPGMRAIDLWRLQPFYGIPYTQPAQILGINLADQSAIEGSQLTTYMARFAQLGPNERRIVLEVLEVLLTGFTSR